MEQTPKVVWNQKTYENLSDTGNLAILPLQSKSILLNPPQKLASGLMNSWLV